jgi:AcrR family transcriptional regulator
MATAKTPKAPRRTAQRILEVSLALFNRFGEPNVSTTLISNELDISPGNLYYHYPAKDELINALFDRYKKELDELLVASGNVETVDDAWLFFHMLFELIWKHRFLYRDLNDLLSKNRKLEMQFQFILKHKVDAVKDLLHSLRRRQALAMEPIELTSLATNMVVLSTYWLSFEYVRNPRYALEPENAGESLMRGAYHSLSVLIPYAQGESKLHLQALAAKYAASST